MGNGTWQWAQTLSVGADGRSFSVADPDGRAAGWAKAQNLLGLGFWSYDWAWNAVHVNVSVSAPGEATLTARAGDSFWGGVLRGARFQVANAASEIDVPGEYIVDGASGTVTFLPPAPVDAPGNDAFLSFADAVVLAGVDPASLPGLGAGTNPDGSPHLRNNNDLMQRNTVPGAAVQVGDRSAAALRHVALRGLTIAFARGSGIVAGGVDDLEISDCDVSHHGRNGALLAGTRISVARSAFSDVGCSGVLVYGGDDLALLDAGSSIADSTVANFSSFVRTYTPGIGWAGVGLDVRNVSLRHAPHSAVMGSGNDAHFDTLVIEDVAWEVSDSGAFYSGYSWVKRGNSVTNSLFRDIVNVERIYNGYPSVQGVYLDDQMSGWTIAGNRFENVMQGSMLGGGRDNVFADNVFTGVTHGLAVDYDNRGENWQHESCVHNSTFTGRLAQDLFNVDYLNPPYATRYPELVRLLDEQPCAPFNNTVANNTFCDVAAGFTNLSPAQAASWNDTLANNSQSCSAGARAPAALPAAAAAVAVDPASVVGATHWSPCYYVSPLPSLWDGCAALARTGTRVIKLILDADPTATYPWNTDWAPIMANVSTLAELAATELYDTALRGRATPLPAWNYDSFALVTYVLSALAGVSPPHPSPYV
jgi:hypothetical protein